MKKWNKIIIDRSNKITKKNKIRNFEYYSQEMGGYDINKYYKDKKSFFEFYYRDLYITWINYLKSNNYICFREKNDTFALRKDLINPMFIVSYFIVRFSMFVRSKLIFNTII